MAFREHWYVYYHSKKGWVIAPAYPTRHGHMIGQPLKKTYRTRKEAVAAKREMGPLPPMSDEMYERNRKNEEIEDWEMNAVFAMANR